MDMGALFTGLTTHKPRDCGNALSYLGEPCLYHHHSTKSGRARCWRSAETHACLECEQEMREGKLHIGFDDLAERHHLTAIRFWRLVSIESWDECWPWQGNRDDPRLLFAWKRPDLRNLWRFHPILVAMWLTYGDVGRVGSISLCGNRRCCNPLHNRPLNLSDDLASVAYDLESLQDPLESFKQELIRRLSPQHLQESADESTQAAASDGNPHSPSLITADTAQYGEAFQHVAQDLLRQENERLIRKHFAK